MLLGYTRLLWQVYCVWSFVWVDGIGEFPENSWEISTLFTLDADSRNEAPSQDDNYELMEAVVTDVVQNCKAHAAFLSATDVGFR